MLLQMHLKRRIKEQRSFIHFNSNSCRSKRPSIPKSYKPIGPFFATEAEAVAANPNSTIVEDAGRGYRKVVASPKPLNFVGINQIKKLLNQVLPLSLVVVVEFLLLKMKMALLKV